MIAGAAGSAAPPDPPSLALRGRRVLFVLGHLELGGAERQAMLLACHLAGPVAARVEVWGMGRPGRVAAMCENAGIPCRAMSLPYAGGRARRWTALAAFALRLRRARFDAVLSYTMAPNVLCGAVIPWTGVKAFVWNQRDEGRGRLGRRLERLALRHTRDFVSNSRHGARFLSGTLGVDPARIRVVPNGVELSRIERDRRGWRESLGLDERAFAACMVSNLHRYKDHPTLLRAWRLALDRWPAPGGPGVLLLAGRLHEDSRGLLDLAEELRLGGSVRFLGEVDDIAGLLGAVDLGVFSSRFEGVPNGILECMAAGLAVAATDIPGIREAVGTDGAELLAPAGDVDALAGRILAAAGDPGLRARVGQANRRRASEEFSARGMCEAMTRVLAEALASRVGSRERVAGVTPGGAL
ncbi:MAG: glycosyltransferase [Acidobacteriia bacterium]|nr:glycosyltransferase [Terriglobia bacterium]